MQKVFIFWELKPVRCNQTQSSGSLSGSSAVLGKASWHKELCKLQRAGLDCTLGAEPGDWASHGEGLVAPGLPLYRASPAQSAVQRGLQAEIAAGHIADGVPELSPSQTPSVAKPSVIRKAMSIKKQILSFYSCREFSSGGLARIGHSFKVLSQLHTH